VKILLGLLAVILFPALCHADCTQKAEFAAGFMNEYKAYCDKEGAGETTLQWVRRNKKVTADFKKAYRKMVVDAQKEDPEMGLGFDPIWDGQDYPQKDLIVLKCDDNSDYVILKGADLDTYRVVLKVIKTGKGWLVDGAGVVSIPKDRQAPRD
jgi:hypothetical protein